MKKTLCIIVDVSGSMNEMGKIHLLRNLCRYAAQLKVFDQEKYADLALRFFQWAENISEILMQSDGDNPALNAEGSSDLRVLSDFLSQQLNNAGSMRTLILSDGNFDTNNHKSFLELKAETKLPFTRTVAVGADADLKKLKEISTDNSVYLAENISSAIDNTIFGSDEPLAAPVSTVQILQSEPAESEEPEEDWDA